MPPLNEAVDSCHKHVTILPFAIAYEIGHPPFMYAVPLLWDIYAFYMKGRLDTPLGKPLLSII